MPGLLITYHRVRLKGSGYSTIVRGPSWTVVDQRAFLVRAALVPKLIKKAKHATLPVQPTLWP